MDCSKVDRVSSLPHEILEAIFRNVLESRQLNALCRVSKLFNRLATPLLYESLEIICPEGLNPRFSILKRFSAKRPEVEFTSSLKYVRHLALTTGFQNLLCHGERCWHHRYHGREDDFTVDSRPRKCKYDTGGERSSDEEDGEGSSDDDDDADTGCECERCIGEPEHDWDFQPNYYEDHFRDFCLALSEDGLRSFRWELGSCVPQNILGKDGYLTRCQLNIERLSLVTDGACDDNMENPNFYDLAKFKRLRDFSWVASQSKEDFEAIRACLITNARHLEVLKLDLVDWSKADDFWYIDHTRFSDDPDQRKNFFAQDILGLGMNSGDADPHISFPVLQSLHLGQFSFRPSISDFAAAFNMFSLRRLVIWNCPGTTELLKHLTTQDLQLVSLELTCGCDDDEDYRSVGFAVHPFLRKLAGLQNLFLNLPVNDWTRIIESIYVHLGTLERVALHARDINFEEDSAYLQLEEDNLIYLYSDFHELFTNGVCEIISIHASPSFLRHDLESHAEDVKCKLLHLRASEDYLKREDLEVYETRDEVDDFADWVFGPKGFPQLLVFAYGDFAFDKSCQDYNALYCRNDSIGKGEDDPDYEVLTPVKKELWNLVTANMDVLSACPYRSVFEV